MVGDDRDVLLGERVDLAARPGTMFLLFGSTIDRVGVARLDRFEDLRGRRVHRLPARDDVLHAEAREQAPHAVADADRDDRGRDRRGAATVDVGDAGFAHPLAPPLDLLEQVGDADRCAAGPLRCPASIAAPMSLVWT